MAKGIDRARLDGRPVEQRSLAGWADEKGPADLPPLRNRTGEPLIGSGRVIARHLPVLDLLELEPGGAGLLRNGHTWP